MCKIIDNNKDLIREYCEKNGLDSEKVIYGACSFNKNEAYIQHVDLENGKGLGLLDETPAPVTLKIFNRGGRLEFEQTEHTATYLAM